MAVVQECGREEEAEEVGGVLSSETFILYKGFLISMVNEEYDIFMKMDLTPYRGKWIAISGKDVISYGKTFKTVFDQAKRKHPDKHPFFTMVPGKESWIF